MHGSLPNVSFVRDALPEWHCPSCLKASLELVPDTLNIQPTAATQRDSGEDWFVTEMESYVFTLMLQCRRQTCMEFVAVSGKGSGKIEPDDNDNLAYFLSLKPKVFVPPLPVFTVPEGCPYEIAEGLREISNLLPVSGTAAINAMRSVLEDMLDTLGVPRERSREGKKPYPLTLHNRIEDYPEQTGKHQAALMALKWVGNSGSHGSRIRNSHIQMTCEVLDDLVLRIYGVEKDLTGKIRLLHDAHARKKS